MTLDVEVWWAEVGADETSVELLDDVERARLAQYRDPAARRRFVAGATLARMVGASVTGARPERVVVDRRCRRCGGPHGRPRIAEAAVELSVTHARDLVGVAVSDSVPIGLDIETLARLPARGGTARLSSAIGVEDGRWSQDLLLRQWVRVESVVKATGDGFTIRPDEVLVSDPDDAPALLAYPGRPGLGMSMRDLSPRPGVVGCLSALTSAGLSITERRVAIG